MVELAKAIEDVLETGVANGGTVVVPAKYIEALRIARDEHDPYGKSREEIEKLKVELRRLGGMVDTERQNVRIAEANTGLAREQLAKTEGAKEALMEVIEKIAAKDGY